MPQILRVGPYVLYFWSNESDPLECIHIHIAEGRPSANATKIMPIISNSHGLSILERYPSIADKVMDRY